MKKSSDYDSMTKDEIANKCRKLELHVMQLRNILAKQLKGDSLVEQIGIDYSQYNRRHVFLKIAYVGWEHEVRILGT